MIRRTLPPILSRLLTSRRDATGHGPAPAPCARGQPPEPAPRHCARRPDDHLSAAIRSAPTTASAESPDRCRATPPREGTRAAKPRSRGHALAVSESLKRPVDTTHVHQTACPRTVVPQAQCGEGAAVPLAGAVRVPGTSREDRMTPLLATDQHHTCWAADPVGRAQHDRRRRAGDGLGRRTRWLRPGRETTPPPCTGPTRRADRVGSRRGEARLPHRNSHTLRLSPRRVGSPTRRSTCTPPTSSTTP